MPKELPIYEIESAIIESVRSQGRLIISAPTGSGKSTQVPQMLLEAGLLDSGQAVILQPRRMAARLLARRVSWERNAKPGDEVGYQIRFENVTSAATRIRYVTEGVLLRQMLQHPGLPDVSTLIFDEFHERHLYGDITLAQALELQSASRPDLKIIVMSATLDAERLEEYLAPCRTLESSGRMFPVDIAWPATPSYADKRPVWDQAAEAFTDYVESGGEGDVLIFMPGGFEISQTIAALRQSDASRGFLLLPLHGELPPEDQDAAVARYDRRKVVVATNVAETSLTIDGVRCVIDSGLARIPRYDSTRGINTLLVEKISRASADQRAGRAGRTAPGKCIRLWSREEHGHRAAQELPEVRRLDLAEVALTLKASGVRNLRQFRWLEPPDEAALAHAEELLTDLGALRLPPAGAAARDAQDGVSEITPTGRKMLAFPLHPRYARMLLAASDFGCVYQACLVAALTQGRDLLLRNVDRATFELREDLLGSGASSDFWLLMRAWNYALKNDFRMDACRRLGIHMVTARQVGPLFQQFLDIAKKEGLDIARRDVPDVALQKCVLAAFSDRVARRLDSGTLRCELVHGRRGLLARESVAQKSDLLVAAEVHEIEGRDNTVNTLLSLATAVEAIWVREMFPEDIETSIQVFFDSTARRVYADEHVRFRGLSIGARRVEPPPLEPAARLLASEIVAGRLRLEQWDHSVEQWILRVNLLAKHCPELGMPSLTEADQSEVIAELCHGSFTYKEIRDKAVKPVMFGWLSDAQRALLDKHAPERLVLSNGRTPKVAYDAANPPHIALRIQELYDVTTTPRIALGRVPVLVHILAPNMRPVQITQDLAGFWRDHYPRVKQELQRKYPRHLWK